MTIPFDPEKYRHHLDRYAQMSEAHKLDLMQYVWSIMEGFVDRAFGQSPEQIIARDKRFKMRDGLQREIAPYEDKLTSEFDVARIGDERTGP